MSDLPASGGDALARLAATIKADAGKGPVPLSVSYLTAGLGDPSITVPADLDANLQAAFQGLVPGLPITVDPANVGAPGATGFTVSQASLSLFGQPQAGAATITFGLAGSGGSQSLSLLITTAPATWSWGNLSPYGTGWPFDWIPVTGATFLFDSTAGNAVQNFSGGIGFPTQFTTVAGLFPSLDVPNLLSLSGNLDFSDVDGDTILFPVGVLEARLAPAGASLQLAYLELTDPVLGIDFPAAVALDDGNHPALNDSPPADQAPWIYLGLALAQSGTAVPGYQLRTSVLPNDPTGAIAFDFAVAPKPGAALLTPAGIIQLAGGASYFEDAPAPLQAFLTNVGLRGMTFGGSINPVALTELSISLGPSRPIDPPWNPLPTANLLDLTFSDFELDWQVTNPLDKVNRTQTLIFSAQTSLLGLPGFFDFEISSALDFHADYVAPAGGLSLNTLMGTMSGGLIALPGGIVDVSVSSISFDYSKTGSSYTFTAGFDLALGFLTLGGAPLLSLEGGSFSLNATPPRRGGSPTVFEGSFSGVVGIGPVYAATQISRRTDGGWSFSLALVQPVNIGDLANKFLSGIGLGPFISTELEVTALAIAGTIPADGSDAKKSYAVSGSFSWQLTLGSLSLPSVTAQLSLSYDGSQPAGSQYARSAAATVTLFDAEVDIAYAFVAGKTTLAVTWEGVTATYSSGDEKLEFTFSNTSIGSLITALAKTVGDPYFTLSAPWDLLDKASLDGLKVDVSLAENAPIPISATYSLPSPIELGFATINGVTLSQQKISGQSKVVLQLDGSTPLLDVPGLDPDLKKKLQNLFNQGGETAGQPVDDLPDPPGRGSDYFDLPLFTMGQRVSIAGMLGAPDVKTVIANMSEVPSSDGDTNPVPAGGGPDSPKGTPYYDRSSDWLIAAHMLILKAGNDWTVDLGFVFHDSDLYGLHLEMAGGKAKALAGLELDILYKKVTDEIGMYQVDWRFPDYVRNLNFGAVSVVLPDIGVQIYTNGDFLIDIGFPYNMDFSRSFAFSVVIAGLPVTGGGGVYFGKLSGATSTFTPPTLLGTFDPVIAFGVGFQVGLGYSFTAGPLSAGFSLTAFAMIEGVIATWHPYQPLANPGQSSVQHDYYFKVTGTIGLIGLLYGGVDFCIIKASFSVNITLSLTISYESFQPIDIEATVSVTVRASVSIDLGLFSITLHFSFHTEAHAGFLIHVDDGNAPWLPPPQQRLEALLERPVTLLPMPTARGRARPVAMLKGLADPDDNLLNLYATVASTVAATDGMTDPAQQQGAFVMLLMMDAPSQGGTAAAGTTSFEKLCRQLLPWLVGHLGGDPGKLTPDLLQTYMNRLADLGDPPLDFSDCLTFLSSFQVRLQALTQANSGQLDVGSVPLPPFDGLTATPTLNGTAGIAVDFSAYVTLDPGYRAGIGDLFGTLAAELEKAGAPLPSTLVLPRPEDPAPQGTESMAAMLFVDMIMVAGRQLLQSGRSAFRSFRLPLTATNNSIAGILAWSRSSGSADGKGISIDDILAPNGTTPLAGGSLTIPAAPYTIRNGDSLQSIGLNFGIGASDLITGNPDARVIAAGLAITVNGAPYSTPAAISFKELLQALGNLEPGNPPLPPWTPAQLAAAMGGAQCLVAGQQLQLRLTPDATGLVVTVAADDTLSDLAARYGTTVAAIGTEPANQDAPLFDTGQVSSIVLNNVTQAGCDDLWQLLLDGQQLPNVAGIVSRFMAAGLRLPVSTAKGALTLSAAFGDNYPGQSDYGLYQLTGQQFPAAPATPAPAAGQYSLTVSRLAGSLAFVEFDTAGGSVVDLVGPLGKLGPVLALAQAGAFNPATTFRILPAVARTAKMSALSAGVGFVPVDPDAVGKLTMPPTEGLAAAAQADAAPVPMLWTLPASLLADAAARQRALDGAAIPYAAQLNYLQALDPQALTIDPVSKAPIQTSLRHHCWATRIGFSVKKLPPPPSSAPLAKLRAFTYEVLPPNAAQAALLEQLVSALGLNDPEQSQLISGLFLAYAQGSGKDAQLLAPADPASPAFFSRTNLSTETHPQLMAFGEAPAPPPAPPPPLGNLANSPEQVARLLWELSTVRSGGYFLTWDMLPDAAFDSTGKADLELVVCYPRNGALTTDRLTAFVNAVLVDDRAAGVGVQVAVESLSAATGAQPLTGASLDQVAALYGLSPGRVAELNATFPLLPQVQLKVGGATHLVTAAEAGDWNAIAAHYPNLTGQEVADANPGVSPVAGTALYLPLIPYTTKAGDSLQAIADSLAIGLDDLATVVAAAPLLTSPATDGTVLAIDPQALDVRPGDASGNVTVELTRPATDPTDTSPASTLAQLFTLLAAGLAGNRYFTGGVGPPIGPQKQDDPMDPGAARRAAERRRAMANPETRRALFAAPATDPLCYRQALGLLGVAQSNVAPAGGTNGQPAGADSPYRGVGTLAQLDLQWRDLFGNILVDQFSAPPGGYSGPVSGEIVPLLYRDKLIGPAAWPGLAAHYDYKSGMLNISLEVLPNTYPDGADGTAAAARDFPVYQRIWYQLNQDYTAAHNPWAAGQAVGFALHNALLAAPDLALSDAQAQVFRDFVNQMLVYLAQRQAGQAGTLPDVAPLAIPVAPNDVAAGNILPLALTLTMRRQGLLVDSALAGLADGETASVDLLPRPDDAGLSGSGYSTFAADFEAMFVSNAGGWSFKVGTSPATGAAADSGDKRTQSLWAVRFADMPLAATPQGLGYTLAPLPLYYAPLPLATSLLSGAFDLYPTYEGGQPYPPPGGTVKQTFTGVDPNSWFQTVLDAVDNALSPDFAAALYLFDKSQGVADPLTGGALGTLLAAKQSLAENIALTVRPILEPAGSGSLWPVPDATSQARARDTLCQALLNQLGPAFATTAIVAFQATQVAGGAVNLYGKPRAALAYARAADVNTTFALSTTRLPLDPAAPASLAFLLDSRNAVVASAAFLSLRLDWDITHVEHAIRAVPGIDDYTDSDWIAFVTAFAPRPFHPDGAGIAQPIDVPVLLRALPQPPTMRGQSAEATFPDADTPAKLAQWNYRADFAYDRAAQDSIATEIDLNSAPTGGGLNAGDDPDPATALHGALAQFVQLYPAVAQAMTAALDAIKDDGTDAAAAAIPVQWFLGILSGVTQSYGTWANSAPRLGDGPPPEAKLAFEIELVAANPGDPATVAINGLTINGYSATLDTGLATITSAEAKVTLPLPVIEIQPDQWTASVTSAAGQDSVRFGYTDQGKAPVSYAQVASVGTRSILMTGLNLFGFRSGQATLQILRNEHLLPDAAPPATTNNAFVFRTPTVQFASPVAPSLNFTGLSIDGLAAAGAAYQAYVDAFFMGLAAGTTGATPVEAAATVTYSYSLVSGAGMPRTAVPVTLMLHTPATIAAGAPPAFAAPLATFVESWRSAHGPTLGGDATVDLALAIYPAGDGDQQPILRVDRISVTAARLAPEPPPRGA